MRKKALVLSLAAVLSLSQAALAIGAGSPTVSNGIGGAHRVDGTADPYLLIDHETGSTTVMGRQSGGTQTVTEDAVSQDKVNGPLVSVDGGPSTGAGAPAAKEITQEEAAAQAVSLTGYNTSITSTYTGYEAGAVNAINSVNANPAALATLPSAENLSQYVMLTGFQEVNVTDAQTGERVNVSAGQCIAIYVPALMPGMRVYLLYVDPQTCMTVKVQARGVDYAKQLVYVDASVPGAFTIVYER